MLFVQTIGRLGDIVNGEHCAKAMDMFLGFIWTNPASDARSCENGVGVSVHPVIAYEMVWNLLSLALIWGLRGKLKPDGMLFALYLALYSVGRFAITFAREDRVWSLGLQEAQYIAILILLITVPLLVVKGRWAAAGEAAAEPASAPRETGTRAERRRRGRGRARAPGSAGKSLSNPFRLRGEAPLYPFPRLRGGRLGWGSLGGPQVDDRELRPRDAAPVVDGGAVEHVHALGDRPGHLSLAERYRVPDPVPAPDPELQMPPSAADRPRVRRRARPGPRKRGAGLSLPKGASDWTNRKLPVLQDDARLRLRVRLHRRGGLRTVEALPGDRLQAALEAVQVGGPDRESCRLAVPAEPEQQVGGLVEGAHHVEAVDAPGAGPARLRAEAEGDGRTLEAVGQPPGDQPQHARRPGLAADEQQGREAAGAGEGIDLPQRLVQAPAGQRAPLPVHRVELRGQLRRAAGIGCRQQVEAEAGVVEPAGGVQPRYQLEAERLSVDGSPVDPGASHQRAQPPRREPGSAGPGRA